MTTNRRSEHRLATSSEALPLDVYLVKAIAQRVVEILNAEHDVTVACRLVDATTLAAALGVKRSWIHAHRDALGAVRLGANSKPRLRFDVRTAREALTQLGSGSANTSMPGPNDGPPSLPSRRNGPAEPFPVPGHILAARPKAT